MSETRDLIAIIRDVLLIIIMVSMIVVGVVVARKLSQAHAVPAWQPAPVVATTDAQPCLTDPHSAACLLPGR